MTFGPTKWVCTAQHTVMNNGNGPPARTAEGGISDEKLIINKEWVTQKIDFLSVPVQSE
jgi:hypothetical protein